MLLAEKHVYLVAMDTCTSGKALTNVFAALDVFVSLSFGAASFVQKP